MRDFLTALQFLTRLSVKPVTDLTMRDFGRSVKFFPLVGVVLGTIYGGAAAIFFLILPRWGITIPPLVGAALILTLTLCATGGIFYDGFMDTMDGIFSGRSREKMLVIMKDSAVGANAVMSFAVLMLLNFSLIAEAAPQTLCGALFIMPIVSRLAVVIAITRFPYVREQGMGKAFADYAEPLALPVAVVTTALFICPWGGRAILVAVTALALSGLLLCYATRVLGGVTGDVYGWTATLTETSVLLAAMFSEYVI